ncbi:MAG: hypothetical protein EBU90_03970 [Proteobacteria bacterium]|nr:hypothetical protein [Pseudomonadota bacterium]NBP14227.1 hypothetical protein [bacterium]
MRFDQAKLVKVGDHLVDVFLDDIIITGIYRTKDNILFSTVDTRVNQISLSYQDVYHKDLTDICDEEKHFLYWARDNKQAIDSNYIDIEIVKKAYISGFANGYNYKKSISFDELMQK